MSRPRVLLRALSGPHRLTVCLRCRQYATATTSISSSSSTPPPPPSPSALSSSSSSSSTSYHPLQPPSHRDPSLRKSQLLRSYVSLLQATPLIVIFQHNNLKAQEWVGIRRELERALQKVDAQQVQVTAHLDSEAQQQQPPPPPLSQSIKLQVVKPTIFEVGLRVAEYYSPAGSNTSTRTGDKQAHHALSEAAYKAVIGLKGTHPLTSLLAGGSTAVLTFPSVSPQYLKAALSILAPTPGAGSAFAAPSRKAAPSYYEPAVQDGIKKLLLLGARVHDSRDGDSTRVLDMDGTRWVAGIDGGLDGLRAQLVSLLQQAGGISLARTLESAGQNLWFTMESRRQDMESTAGSSTTTE